jgi:hypothetical protein
VEYSLSVTVPVDICSQLFSKDFQREILSPYAIAFIGVSQLNIRLAREQQYPDKMAYVMDKGNPYAGQLQFGHAFQMFVERTVGSSFTGILGFQDDATSSAIQAADVIAWASRRRVAEGLMNEFAPLDGLFTGRYDCDNLAISPHYV